MHLDRFGDKPRVIRAKRGFQLLLPAGGGGLRLTHQASVCRSKVAIAKPLSSPGQTRGEVDVGREGDPIAHPHTLVVQQADLADPGLLTIH